MTKTRHLSRLSPLGVEDVDLPQHGLCIVHAHDDPAVILVQGSGPETRKTGGHQLASVDQTGPQKLMETPCSVITPRDKHRLPNEAPWARLVGLRLQHALLCALRLPISRGSAAALRETDLDDALERSPHDLVPHNVPDAVRVAMPPPNNGGRDDGELDDLQPMCHQRNT